ncbi:MAG TPA: DUF6789 family protein [Abditibacteriaceae bacterium]|nr:DUF6789 family protein [Abditibacteriaceae bacterium]
MILRAIVWLLASLSFAALLWEFYGLGKMRSFALITFLPAIVALVVLARSSTQLRRIIVEGAIGGVVAAVVYDVFRVPFVLWGYPLFAVFPKFGQMLLGIPLSISPARVPIEAHIVGWIYHFINGASLGIMFLAMAADVSRKWMIPAAAAWALCVEVLLLLSPYYNFFQLKMDRGAFLILTLSAHLVFGVVLGWWLARRLSSTRSSPV